MRNVTERELEEVIGRAAVDQEFRIALFANPKPMLAGYELTETEVAAFRFVDAESLDECGGIGRRIRQTSVVSPIWRHQETILV